MFNCYLRGTERTALFYQPLSTSLAGELTAGEQSVEINQ